MRNKKQLDVLLEKVENNMLAESNDVTNVAGQFSQLILPLVKKLYLDSLITQIADIQPLSAPMGKIGALYSTYSGDGSSAETHTHPDSSFIIVVDDASHTELDDVITIGTSTFMIRYVEDKKILISRETGTYIPVITNTYTDSNSTVVTIEYSSYNRAAIKKLFKGYAGGDKNAQGVYVGYAYGFDDDTNVRQIGFETRTVNAITESRKLKSKMSWEQLQDMLYVYKESGVELAGESIANEIRQEIDNEFISYLKYIAKYTVLPPATIDLTHSLSREHSLKDVTDDLVVNIFLAAEQIVKDTKRNRTLFVLADPITAAFLQTNAVVAKAVVDENNPYRVGTVGSYPLFSDLYAEVGEYYIMVGYLGSNNNDGDAGIIYSPYTTTLHVVPGAGDFKENLLYLDRYAITRHPQDSGNVDHDDKWASVNQSNSDFFKMFIVDYGTTTLVNFTDTTLPNLI